MSSVPTPPSTGPAPQQFVYQESQLPVQPPPQQQLQQPPPPPQQQQHIYPQQQPNFPYHNNLYHHLHIQLHIHNITTSQ